MDINIQNVACLGRILSINNKEMFSKKKKACSQISNTELCAEIYFSNSSFLDV